jgi:hypothetical protein
VDSNLNSTPAGGLEWLNLDAIVTGDDYTRMDSNLGLGEATQCASECGGACSSGGSDVLTHRISH